jgi:KDO2-lipid IV(A) lauroyltransferase
MRLRQQVVRGLALVGIDLTILLARIFPWKWGVRLGKLLGMAAYYCLPRERHRTLKHLTLALGSRLSPQELQKTARACFAHLGMGFFELINLPRLDPDRFSELILIEGEENLSNAMKEGRGVIYIGGHIGNWELMAAVVAIRGYPLKVIAAPIYDPRLDQLMSRYRSRFGIETIQRGSTRSTRQILSGLRQGCMMAFLIDQNTRVEGAYVDFFGHPAYTPVGVASLALRSDIPVVMGYSHRLNDGRHQIVFQKPLPLIRSEKAQEDIKANTAIFTKCLEEFILKHPEQWVWMHRRWG